MAAILVVDDEEDIRELVGIYLKNEGFKVYKAADGQEALKCLDDMQIDLAILDVMMADMDGIALMLEIRKKEQHPYYNAVGKDQDMDKVIGLSAGQMIILQSLLTRLNLLQELRHSLEDSMILMKESQAVFLNIWIYP